MKAFWFILVLLIIAAVVLVMRGRMADTAEPVTAMSSETTAATPPVAKVLSTKKTPEPPPVPASLPPWPQGPADAATPDVVDEIDLVDPAALAADLMASANASLMNITGGGVPGAPRYDPADEPEPSVDDDSEFETPTVDATALEPLPLDENGLPEGVDIVVQDDGSWLVDDLYIVKGTGTPEDPYRFGFDLLVSSAETYQPRSGKNEIPTRVAMLHDKHCKITGYVAFPLMFNEVREGLLMLNQWDGCCIGIPPSPYDGIEFRLTDPMKIRRGHYIAFGTVEGLMKVDPYLVNNWLVGLYLMEETDLVMGDF